MYLVSEMAEQEVAALRDEGITPTFREVLWLNDLGSKIEHPPGEPSHAARGAPVRAGNVILHPWTIASNDWYYDVAYDQYDTDDGRSMAMAFALAHGKTPEVFADLITRSDIYRAINQWKARCTATIDELREAARMVRPQVEPHDLSIFDTSKNKACISWDEVICDLVAGTGLDEAYWRARPHSVLHDYWYAVQQQTAAGGMDEIEKNRVRKLNLDFQRAIEAIRISRKQTGAS